MNIGLNSIAQESIKIPMGKEIKVTWGAIEDFFRPVHRDVRNREKAYAINNNIIAFFWNGVFYVTPYTLRAHSILQNNKFPMMGGMYVPFAHGDYPTDEKERWEKLLKEKAEERQSEEKKASLKDVHIPINNRLLYSHSIDSNDNVAAKYEGKLY